MILYHSSNVYLLEHTGPPTPLSCSTSCYKKGDPNFVCLKKLSNCLSPCLLSILSHSKVTSFKSSPNEWLGSDPHTLSLFFPLKVHFFFSTEKATSNYTNRLRAGKWAQTPFFNLVLLNSSSHLCKTFSLFGKLDWVGLSCDWMVACIHTPLTSGRFQGFNTTRLQLSQSFSAQFVTKASLQDLLEFKTLKGLWTDLFQPFNPAGLSFKSN